MKKVYFVLTLFIASLFFYSNKVYAATYTYELSEETMAYINDDFFEFREKVIQYVEDNGYAGYLISHSYIADKLEAYVYHTDYNAYLSLYYGSDYIKFYHKNKTLLRLNSNNELYVVEVDTNNNALDFYASKSVLKTFLDISLSLTYQLQHTLLINYKDLSYTLTAGSEPISVYKIYLDYNVPEEPVDKFLEEKEIMNNFYSTIFTKIGELATNFANNYTFLLIFGIFILIFIFEIIRRRLI